MTRLGLRLAGKCARAAQYDRAGDDSGGTGMLGDGASAAALWRARVRPADPDCASRRYWFRAASDLSPDGAHRHLDETKTVQVEVGTTVDEAERQLILKTLSRRITTRPRLRRYWGSARRHCRISSRSTRIRLLQTE